jgi:hypothetical protein
MSQDPFAAIFGNAANLAGAASATAPRKKAEFWMNVGYEVGDGSTDANYNFVSLPAGIPLDTTDKIDVRSAGEYGQFQTRRNGLLDTVLAEAAKLAPGESRIFGPRGGLQIQLRRVAQNEAPVITAETPFAPPTTLLA